MANFNGNNFRGASFVAREFSWFVVRWVTVVDHPELRNESLPSVKPGHVIVNSPRFETRREAVAFFNDIVAGEYDCDSEYVRSVDVSEHFPRTGSRTVRKRVERDGMRGAA
jgi:hypothetical protein